MKDEKRITKVTKFKIVKPLNMSWKDFGKMLRDVRYRFWRLANMAVCENYINFYNWKNGIKDTDETYKIKNINRRLKKDLLEEKVKEEDLLKYSRDGVVFSAVYSAFEYMKLKQLKSKSNWSKVLRGKSNLPLFRNDLAIPIKCCGGSFSPIEKIENGDYVVDLRICKKPYPKVLLSTEKLSGGEKAILNGLVSNKTNSTVGYRHRFFELKKKGKYWFLYVIYDFPKVEKVLNPTNVVGVDLGYSMPLYAATNKGCARIGWKKLKSLSNRIKSLQKQTIARRRSIQNGGNQDLAKFTSRSGHGRNRILLPIEKLRNKIDNAYTTLNHQLSNCVVEFAKNNNSGVIQIENLEGLKEVLKDSFLGRNWRRYQLQQFINYKAEENGIVVKVVNPCYTSRRCSKCGYIWDEFNYKYRKENNHPKFSCPECKYEEDADYNAALNLATIDIECKIKEQCRKQGLKYKEIKSKKDFCSSLKN